MANLQDSSFSQLFVRGLKKMVIELTSVKFLLLVFIGAITYFKICSDIVGISAMLALTGMREAIGVMATGFYGYKSTTIFNEQEITRTPKVPE